MPSRPDTVARALLAATMLSTIAPSPASAARLQLWAEGSDTYLCAAHTTTRDGRQMHSTVLPVNSQKAAFFDIGELPTTLDGDSPDFESLKLTCWIHNRRDQPSQPYSVELHRWESFWLAPHAATGWPAPSLPRDGTMIGFKLATTEGPAQPRQIRIVSAWAQPDYWVFSPRVEYDHLDFYHRLSPAREAP
ncbi:hypothetical protein GALL_385510 [mine drainage metagenome]|jgi:hypothetical protein|uniref:Uncharacterized protein n=1 Tax=mine drainage metagenome TaxID=410659 RepID=A0A1J5Q7M3_9ZZZZ